MKAALKWNSPGATFGAGTTELPRRARVGRQTRPSVAAVALLSLALAACGGVGDDERIVADPALGSSAQHASETVDLEKPREVANESETQSRR